MINQEHSEYTVIAIGKNETGKSTVLNSLIQTNLFGSAEEENFMDIINHNYKNNPNDPEFNLYEIQTHISEINKNYLDLVAKTLIDMEKGINQVIVTISLTEQRIDISPIVMAINLFGKKIRKNHMKILLTQKKLLSEELQNKFNYEHFCNSLISLCEKKEISIKQKDIIEYDKEDNNIIKMLFEEMKNRTTYECYNGQYLSRIKSELMQSLKIKTDDANFASLILLSQKNKELYSFIQYYLEQCDEFEETAKEIANLYNKQSSIQEEEVSLSPNTSRIPKSFITIKSSLSSRSSSIYGEKNIDNNWVVLSKEELTPSFADYRFSNDQIRNKEMLIKRICTGIKVGIKSGATFGKIVKLSGKLPIIGAGVGVTMATIRLVNEEGIKNKLTKGGLELLSGGLSAVVPGVGTVISIYLDGVLGVIDEEENLVEQNENTHPNVIDNNIEISL